MSNALTKYQRTPKLYIKLPSGGKYYKEGSIDLSMEGTLPIRAMTARDELLLKSPDALLNGESITNMIRSCCSEIKFNVKDLIAPDVEAILLAIFHASYGDSLEFDSLCPKCEYKNTFTASIESVLATVKDLEPPYVIKEQFENGDVMEIYLKPSSYEAITKKSLEEFENAKMIQNLASSKLEDSEKIKKFSESVGKMANYNFEMVVDVIEKIVVPADEPTEDHKVDVVTDREVLKGFIFEADSKLIKKINKLASEINSSGVNKTFTAVCQKEDCKHEWSTNIEFDPTSFFGADSSR